MNACDVGDVTVPNPTVANCDVTWSVRAQAARAGREMVVSARAARAGREMVVSQPRQPDLGIPSTYCIVLWIWTPILVMCCFAPVALELAFTENMASWRCKLSNLRSLDVLCTTLFLVLSSPVELNKTETMLTQLWSPLPTTCCLRPGRL